MRPLSFLLDTRLPALAGLTVWMLVAMGGAGWAATSPEVGGGGRASSATRVAGAPSPAARLAGQGVTVTYTLTTSVAPAAGGSVSLDPSGPDYESGTIVQLTASSSPGYHFTSWTGDTSATANPLDLTMDADKSVTANFALDTHTLTVSATHGTVSQSPLPVSGAYDYGTVVTLTATPDSGYAFDSWSGDATGAANPTTVTMDADKSVTASFAPVPPATIAAGSSASTLSPGNPSVILPVTLTRTTGEGVRAFSVEIQLSPDLQLSTPVDALHPRGSISEGTFLSAIGPTAFQVVDDGGGLYTVDGTILGSPCGATATTGLLFTVGVSSPSTTACAGTISIVNSVAPLAPRLRDCNNNALAVVGSAVDGQVPIDNNAPVLAGMPSVLTFHTGPGATACGATATWTAPTATDPCGGSVTVASDHAPGETFPVGTTRVTYTATDAAGNAATASFTVTVLDDTPPTVALTAPNGGEAWLVGSIRSLTWTASDNCATAGVDLVYSTDGGATYPDTIATGIANSGSFAWTIPNTPTTTARVKVTVRDSAGNAGVASSAANFALVGLGGITDLASAQAQTGNDGDGTTKIRVSWTAPPPGAAVEIWRKGFGNYPEYGDAPSPGAVPGMPAGYPPVGWTLARTVTDGSAAVDDEVAWPARDYYYYVAYVKSGGVVSPVSNETNGQLNYHLGDVTSPAGGPGTGDNIVDALDISLLGAHYGITLGPSDPLGYLDVGPSTTNFVDGLPTTDNRLDFEDLVLFAINYGQVGGPQAVAQGQAAARDQLTLETTGRVVAGDDLKVRLAMEGTGAIQALSTTLTWNPAVVDWVSCGADEMVDRAGGVVLSAKPGVVDAALFGAGRGFLGAGAMATVTFHARATGDPGIHLASVIARDLRNGTVGLGTAEALSAPDPPPATQLARAVPNPFRESAVVAFSLAQRGPVDLAIYSVDGRRVRTLARDTRGAGEYRVAWDGRDDRGATLSAGVYYAQLVAGPARFTKSLTFLK